MSKPKTDLRFVSRTDRGLVRENNQDSVAALPELGLVIVADGMGGYKAGEVASHMAVETIMRVVKAGLRGTEETSRAAPDAGLVSSAVSSANREIYDATLSEPAYAGMGTTVVMGLFTDATLLLGHVGDSRVYRLREGKLERLTTDHSVIQELVTQGMFASLEEALSAGVRNNVLTRALGVDEQVEVQVSDVDVCPGDIYVFCSDGLTNMVADAEIERVLGGFGGDIVEAADHLVDLARTNGGVDNISVVLAQSGG